MNRFNRNRLKFFLMLLGICVMIFAFAACAQNIDEAEYKESSAQAIIAFLKEDKNIEIDQEELDNMIVGTFETEEGSENYILKDTVKTVEKKPIYIFVVGVEGDDKGGYICEKVTADYSLETHDKVEDVDYEPFSFWSIPIDQEGLYTLDIGMIFDSSHTPYFKGEELELDEDNIFYVVKDDVDEEIVFKT